MALLRLAAEDVRNIEAAQLELSPALTLIWGANGSGKTSLLEAMFLLGRGRSFRTRNTDRLIRYGQAHLRVTGQLTADIEPLPVGIEVRRGSVTARVAARPVESLAELSRAFPVQVIEPGIHRLVEEGGHRRRRWIDWAVFHVEPQFVDTWVRYARALKQRNAALRTQPSEAALWDPEVARLGELISQSRSRVVESLQPYWHAGAGGTDRPARGAALLSADGPPTLRWRRRSRSRAPATPPAGSRTPDLTAATSRCASTAGPPGKSSRGGSRNSPRWR